MRYGAIAALALAAAAGAQSPTAGWRDKLSRYYGATTFHMYSVPMADGVVLSVAVWRPEAPGEKVPAIMIATPYNKLAPRYVEQGVYFAHHGYAYVAYDKRGRYDSDGEVSRYGPKDGEDLNAMQDWAARQPWSSGKVGTLGGSASGLVQWLGALYRNPHLAAMIPEVAPDDHFYNTFPDGAFQLSNGINALFGSSGARTNTPPDVIEDWDKWYRFLPLKDLPDYIGIKNSHIWRWEVAHPLREDAWPGIGEHPAPGHVGPGKYDGIRVPTFNLTGWYDQTLTSVIASFLNMQRNGPPELRETHKLMIGPWTHSALFQTGQGQLVYPAQAAPNGLEWRLRWFDRHLKGIDNGLEREPPVYIYVMGADQWRNECEWPLARTKYLDYYLHSSGRANTSLGDGALSAGLPQGEAPDRFTYDPNDPVPTLGGNVAMQPPRVGPYDQRPIELRNDVLVYSTPPLVEDVEVTGPVVLRLYASTDRTDTDFTGKLIDVHPNGFAQILTEGIIRGRYRNSFTQTTLLTPGAPTEFYIDLWATSNVFRKGHRIRLEVSSSNFPKYDRNPNTGDKFGENARLLPAKQTVYHDAAHPSRLVLPVIAAGSRPCEAAGR